MIKGLKLFVILVIVVSGTFGFANKTLFHTAKATYVEGLITQDTIWTLVDSPFVVVRDVTVCSNVTLTIEAGVEVRFGESFSLVVEGRLDAQGAQDNMIMFTSNKGERNPEDWGTIEFRGAQLSTFVYCVVEYATNGITVENGTLKIQHSTISSNYKSGIRIVGGNLEVKYNEVVDNAENGIYITGDNQVTIHNNTIKSNGDGVILAENSTSGINISQNVVLLNEQAGVHLDSDNYNDLVILSNTLSSNHYGFQVSGNGETRITNNSISYNTVGFFYEAGNNHVASFNDIYGNDLGMGVSSDVTVNVNAEYNYWGDESGPYHESLNPAGRGNPVGGDGVNLDFIFFLTAPISYMNERPTAKLLTDKSIISPNQTVMFIASSSSDDRRVDKYFFDFGDGKNSSWTTLSIFVYEYSLNGTYHVHLTVMDDFGVTSENVAEATINVQDLTSLQVSITSGSHTVGYGEEVSMVVQVTDGITTVESATVAFLSINEGSFTPSSGLTNSTGYLTATFTAPNVTETTNVRIIATASKTGYADGSDYQYLDILPPLLVQVSVDPDHAKSEQTVTVTVHVTYQGQPVAEALVIMSSDYGNFLTTTGITNSEGNAVFSFSTPTTDTRLDVTITASVTKIGCGQSVRQTLLTVEPKTLVVDVGADLTILISETISHITVHVTYENNPISNATVRVSSDAVGNFSATTELTDSNGNATFIFTAPQANTPLNVSIEVTATKAGYVVGEDHLEIVVYPGTLDVQVTNNPATIESKGTSVVTVYVTCNATPVEEALVTVLSDSGNFSTTTGLTNSSGYCNFVFEAPRTTVQLTATVVANVTKNGYLRGVNQTTITVTPETVFGDGGWPLLTILLIIVPIVIVVIIFVLIKLKIIKFSIGEES